MRIFSKRIQLTLIIIVLLFLPYIFSPKNAEADFPLKVPKVGFLCPDKNWAFFQPGFFLATPNTNLISTPDQCFNFCDQNFIDQANAAFKRTNKNNQNILNDYLNANGTRYTQSKCYTELSKKFNNNPEPVDCTQENDTTRLIDPKHPGDIKYCVVNENVFNVRINFFGVPKPTSDTFHHYLCLRSNLNECTEKEWIQIEGSNDYKSGDPNGQQTYCGDGKHALKMGSDCAKDGKDWFWPETTYRVYLSIGTSKNKDNLKNNIVRIASFYVEHFYPDVLAPESSLVYGPKAPGQWDNLYVDSLNVPNPKKTAELLLTLQGRNNKGSGNSNTYNDYFVTIFSTENDYKTRGQCIFVKDEQPQSITVQIPHVWQSDEDPSIPPVELVPGSYVLRIKDGIRGNFDATYPSCGEGDFTYYDIPFRIGRGKITCHNIYTNKDNPCTDGGDVAMPIQDPFGKEKYKPATAINPPAVCTAKDPSTGLCLSIPTALGFSIHTKPQEFIKDLFTLVLSIGGIAAFAFFIRAGYTLMTSAGNKEKVGAAREQITAAITGLIFIILSIVMLQFIGYNILHIPGFGN